MASTLILLSGPFLLGYLFGSIPFGLLLTRAAGLGDIRKVGSGNIGATNVLRTGRKGLAVATLLLDALKGIVPVLIADQVGQLAAVGAAGGAVIGHMFPVWLDFKGGKGGAIVNISSGASRLGSPGEYVDYAASKGAIDTMTLGLAKELAADGIRVNCVRPGLVHTEIHAAGGEPNRIERLRDGIPMKRGGEPEEVARAVLWLLSDEASYSTGAILDVTGGR